MRKIEQSHWKEHIDRTAFHDRIKEAAVIQDWYRWHSYAVINTAECPEMEYFAVRAQTGVFDLSPMCTYDISGPDALAFMNRLVTRDVAKIKPGRVGYTVWCTDMGKVIDDGTIFHLKDGVYRLCSYEKQMDWLSLSSLGFDIEIDDCTDEVPALAVQGPTSCAILKDMGLTGIENLKPFGITYFDFEGSELMVSRTGFTGDLGYELWTTKEKAIPLWDALFAAGKDRGIRVIGGAALDMVRIEAGFLQAGEDFHPALSTIRKDHDRSPFELGLDWLVNFKKGNFTGRRALLAEKEAGPKTLLVRLEIAGNKPADESFVYADADSKTFAGTVTSAMWSPSAKKNIAYASVDAKYGEVGQELYVDVYYQRELHWSRSMPKAVVVKDAAWNPARRRATPPADF